jgi:hypothetical protein
LFLYETGGIGGARGLMMLVALAQLCLALVALRLLLGSALPPATFASMHSRARQALMTLFINKLRWSSTR